MIVFGAVTGFLVTLVLCPIVVRELARRAVLDNAGDRSSHSVPTLRGGGVAPAVGACVGAAVASRFSPGDLVAVATVATAFGVLGLADDLFTVSARRRLFIQQLIAAVGVVGVVSDMTSGLVLIPAAALAWVWLVAYVNAFNFMDGINGISAAQVIVAGSYWSLIGMWEDKSVVAAGGLVIAASALAFLPFNFPRAKVFLGDVGSYFLGGWLAMMVAVAIGYGLAPDVVIAPVLLYLADTGTTLLRRALRGVPLTQPHREHVYQQLVMGGWTHTRVTAFVALVIALSSLLGAATLAGGIGLRAAANLALALLLVAYLRTPWWQRRSHRTHAVRALRGG